MKGTCRALFVDRTGILYCSLTERHRVITFSLRRRVQLETYSFGQPFCGSTSEQFCCPTGIHVSNDLHLYVADTDNDRIQLFTNRTSQGTTILGGNERQMTNLSRPTAVIMDQEGTLFILDRDNRRILHYFWSNWKCLVGCQSQSEAVNSELSSPGHLAFDREGNLFVLDQGNQRIEKYQLERNTCCKSIAFPSHEIKNSFFSAR